MPSAKKVFTPGSSVHVKKKKSSKKKHLVVKIAKKMKKSIAGRPAKSKKQSRVGVKHRTAYTEDDMMEAIRLVTVDNWSIQGAAKAVNARKVNQVPRMTFFDRLNRNAPEEMPVLGRPVELSAEVEKALVKCLIQCGEYQYPMRKSDLQNLVQAYCVENNIETRWKNHRPAREWCRLFLKRWNHEVKLRRPTNIKRSRARVSPQIIQDFFARAGPNLEGIPASHIINYDETNLQVPKPLSKYVSLYSREKSVIQQGEWPGLQDIFTVW